MLAVSFNLAKQYANFPEIRQEEVQKIVQWCQAQPHLPNLSESEMLIFYNACGHSSEYTKQVIDLNLTYRTHVKEFFTNLDINSSELKQVMEILGMCMLPKLTHEGHRVIFLKLIDLNPSHFHFVNCVKFITMFLDIWSREEDICAGHRFVIDLSGATLGHISRLSIMTMKKFLLFLQEAAPIHIEGFHFVNIVPFMDALMSLVTPFLKEEFLNILYIHNNLEDLYKYVPCDILPKELGGMELYAKELREIYFDKMRQKRDEILAAEKYYRINEKLRPGKPKNSGDLFGIEGNFKQLDFD